MVIFYEEYALKKFKEKILQSNVSDINRILRMVIFTKRFSRIPKISLEDFQILEEIFWNELAINQDFKFESDRGKSMIEGKSMMVGIEMIMNS